MATEHKVVWGDTLWSLSIKYGVTVDNLVEWNDIEDRDFIVVGQVLKLVKPSTKSENKTSTPVIKAFGLQTGTDRTIYASWSWDKTNTDHYEVLWTYDSGDKVWFEGSSTTVAGDRPKSSTYAAPINAKQIKFKVKPISKTHTVNNTETSYWTAKWSTEKVYNVDDIPPEEPSTPTVEIKDGKLTAKVTGLSSSTTRVEFQVVKNDKTVCDKGTATVYTATATFSCTVDPGAEYKVRCRAHSGNRSSAWSDYSENIKSAPTAPPAITTINPYEVAGEIVVYLEWPASSSAENYEIQYTTNEDYFEGSNAVSSVNTEEAITTYRLTGLEIGKEYFFRIRAVNDQGESDWSAISSVLLGKKPQAPTTWSSTTTVIVGEPLKLYWVHNAEDGSSETFADLEVIVNGADLVVGDIRKSTDPEEKDKTSVYDIDTSQFREGTVIKWRVRTAGVSNEYGEWSIERTIDVYARPTLEIGVTDVGENLIETLTAFPFYVYALAGPNTQTPIGYHVSIVANEAYEAVDNVGNVNFINAGDNVYSKYFDIADALLLEFTPDNVDLENNINYTIKVVVSMNSGLTAEASSDFTVAWTDLEYEPNAEIAIDRESLAAYIRPYCDDSGNIRLSVYRREYDGMFTEIATGLNNDDNTFVTDPHPALDFARYRIVAVDQTTGAVSYSDIPGCPVGEKAAVIQWNESWSNFDTTEEAALEDPPWVGSMLKLPYNIDVSDSYSPDVSLIEYIGRSHPVGYYGTQRGQSSSWSMDIPKSDKDTLYALRRLAIWQGDVYVREPSGSGYWANVSVSFSQTHCEVTIPVSLNITRVEGGI